MTIRLSTVILFAVILCLSLGLRHVQARGLGLGLFAARHLNGLRPASGGEEAGPEFDGRKYHLYIPQSLRPGEKTPLLIALHGGGGNASHIEDTLGMDPMADKYGFAIAYLNGTPGRRMMMRDKRTWNAGGCCGVAQQDNVDDVGYIHGFIKYMIKTGKVDPARVFLMGHSNGTMMAYRFVCEDPGVVSAIVAVSGALMVDRCSSVKGLRVLHVHGDQDQNVPIQGGQGRKSVAGVDFPPLQYTKDSMIAAGADFNLKLVPGADHEVKNIRKVIDLPEIAAQFLLDK